MLTYETPSVTRQCMTGQQVRAARTLAGLTQTQLAQRAGLSRSAISYLEARTRKQAWYSVSRIIAALEKEGVSVALEPFELSMADGG